MNAFTALSGLSGSTTYSCQVMAMNTIGATCANSRTRWVFTTGGSTLWGAE